MALRCSTSNEVRRRRYDRWRCDRGRCDRTGHFVKEPKEVFCRLVGYALVGDASHLRQDLGCFHHIGWFVSLATVWTGREIWRIGFDEKPVIRKRRRDRANGFAGLECKHAGK